MLTTVTKQDFEKALNTEFVLHATPEQTYSITLIQVHTSISSAVQDCFSLVFLAPQDAPREQATFKLEHKQLGTLEIFLVPVKLDARGLRLEAVFNRLLG
jgi:hypothetical protein